MSTKSNAREMLALEEDQIFARLGVLIGTAAGALPSDGNDRPETVGRRWWMINYDSIHDLVCGSDKVRAACEGKTWDRITVFSVVVDAIKLTYGLEISFAVSSLVIKQGLVELCSKSWD